MDKWGEAWPTNNHKYFTNFYFHKRCLSLFNVEKKNEMRTKIMYKSDLKKCFKNTENSCSVLKPAQ